MGELLALVHDTNADFSPYLMATMSELPCERHYVDVLEEPEAECVVDLVECADHATSKRFFDELGSSHARTMQRRLKFNAIKTLQPPSNDFPIRSGQSVRSEVSG